MKITVVNGSPKGAYSITLQTLLYLEKKYPEHSFSVLQAGQKIKSLEKDFESAKKMLEEADAISAKMYLVGALLSNEKILAKMGNKMNEGMLAPYKKLFEKLDS